MISKCQTLAYPLLVPHNWILSKGSRAKIRPFPLSFRLLNQPLKRIQACSPIPCLNSSSHTLFSLDDGKVSIVWSVQYSGDEMDSECTVQTCYGITVMIMQTWPLRQSIHSMSQLRLLTLAGEWESLCFILSPPIHVSQKLRSEMSTVLYNPTDKQVKGSKLSVLNLQ